MIALGLAGGPAFVLEWAKASCSSNSSCAMRWTCRDTGEVGRGGRWFGAMGAKCTLCGGALDGLACVVDIVEDERGDGTL